MKIWIDDIRQAPEGYVWCHSVNQVKELLNAHALCNPSNARDTCTMLQCHGVQVTPKDMLSPIELIDIDHDSGDYARDGGDYVRVLDWLEETNRNYPIRIHSMNPVGVQNMRAIIEYNDWEEVR